MNGAPIGMDAVNLLLSQVLRKLFLKIDDEDLIRVES